MSPVGSCCSIFSKDPHYNMLQSLIFMRQHQSQASCTVIIWIRYLCMCLKALLGDLLPQSAPPLPSKHAPVDGCAHKPTLIVWCLALAGSNIRISIWKLAAGRCCCHCCCCVLCSPSGWQLLCSLQPSAHRALLHSWLLLCISCTLPVTLLGFSYWYLPHLRHWL